MPDPLLHPEFETLSTADVLSCQETAWQRQWDYVRACSALYRGKLADLVHRCVSLDGLEALPLTGKDELRASQERLYPYGTYAACDEDSIVRLHRTSGTTGRALNLANTRSDAEWIARVGGRAMYASGLRPSDRVVHCLNYCLWMGGVTDHLTLEAAGATVVPFGVGNTRRLLDAVAELGVTAISCTPSYPALLERHLRELGCSPADLGLRLALFGGEAGLDNPAFRASLESTWGFGVRNANYGLSEVLSTLGSQCERTTDLHFHGADCLFAEILHPATAARLPLREGTTGELVLTHLRKECQPLVRYGTRDIVTVTGTGPCECGRTGWRFRVTGRTDDMFNVRGINVFPSAIRHVVEGRPDLASGQFRIVLRGPGPYDRVVMEAEAASGLDDAAWDDAARVLEGAVRDAVGASAQVTMLAFDSLPRTEGKTAWIDRRPA